MSLASAHTCFDFPCEIKRAGGRLWWSPAPDAPEGAWNLIGSAVGIKDTTQVLIQRDAECSNRHLPDVPTACSIHGRRLLNALELVLSYCRLAGV